jgi:hypothetical protein
MLLEESTIGKNISKGVDSIAKGIKWLIKKIIELAKRIRDSIKNIFKPKAEKQIKEMEETENTVISALDSVGIKHERKPFRKRAIPVEYKNMKAEDFANKAKDGFDIKDTVNSSGPGTIIKMSNGEAIIELDRSLIINIAEYKKIVDRYVVPLIKSKFDNVGLIQAARLRLGDTGRTIPIFRKGSYDFTIDTAEFFPEANELTEHIVNILNMPEVKEMENDPNIDPYFSDILNGLATALNMINIVLRDIDLCIAFKYQNPFDNFELAAIRDRKMLGDIIEHIILHSDIKNTMRAYSIVKPFIIITCKTKKWIRDVSDAPSGATRIAVLTNDRDKFVYKYAWNRKGIFDNKLDLKIKNIVSKDIDVADKFALPTDESSESGIYVIVPKASIRRNIDFDDMRKFEQQLEKSLKNKNIRLQTADMHEDNVGFINGKMVVVDYGNFKVY